MVGFFVNYMLIKKYKSWTALCDDFNKVVVQDEFPKLTPKVAMVFVPLICMSVFSIIWMPFLIYVGSQKK
ncbi:hypothetical protein D3C85_748920 [compost metagenome]